MYSNYITEVGKLVYLIGEIETTSNFKKMLDPNDHKYTVNKVDPSSSLNVSMSCLEMHIRKWSLTVVALAFWGAIGSTKS